MPDQIKIDAVQKVIDELEGVAEERIKAMVNFEREMEVLEDLGYQTIDKVGKGVQELDVKIQKREMALNEEFEEFMEDYGETLE